MNLADIAKSDLTKEMKILMKSESGLGKTVQAVTWPKPIAHFDLDRRIKTAATYWRSEPWLKDITVYSEFRSWKDFEDQYNSVVDGSANFATVIVDGLTFLGDFLIQMVMDYKGGKGTTKKIGEVSTSDIEVFNAESSGLTQVVNAGREYKGHFILTAHVVKTSDKLFEKGGTRTVESRALLTAGKKVAAKLPGGFNEVYHFDRRIDEKGHWQYCVRTHHMGEDMARTSLLLPETIDLAIGDKLYDKIIQEHNSRWTQPS